MHHVLPCPVLPYPAPPCPALPYPAREDAAFSSCPSTSGTSGSLASIRALLTNWHTFRECHSF
ncbi:hypothetical protein E2C01_090949 [Portunus trituberculatus]|uniref:Uncharacterized protein n=1 Tax=Portunus trituberculatus TaxID=210409 RepID=A0A5B7JM88_PORTR|nr:hypothetical protein [Portunus trituberculatus]